MKIQLLGDRFLSSVKVAKTKLFADGDRLHFRVQPTGAKNWIFIYEIHGRQRRMGLGSYPTVTLSMARLEADKARKMVASGIDPLDAREAAKAAAKLAAERKRASTIREAALDWKTLALEHARKDHGKGALRAFTKDVFPVIGDLAPDQVTLQHIQQIGNVMRARGIGRMMNVVLSDLRQFFQWAIENKLATSNPTSTIKKPKFGGRDGEGTRVLSDKEIVWVFKRLEHEAGRQTMLMCLLLLATLNRIGETCFATWDEINLEERLWVIPASHRKGTFEYPAVEHHLPLSDFAIAVLTCIRGEYPDSGHLFVDASGLPLNPEDITSPLTDKQTDPSERETHKNECSTVLLPAGGKWSPHDLRRSSRTLLASLGVIPKIAERCIGHYKTAEPMERIYDRYKYMPEMRIAMDKLGEHLEKILTPASAAPVEAVKMAVAPKWTSDGRLRG